MATGNRFSLNRTLGVAIIVVALVSLLGNGLVLGALARLQQGVDARGRSNELLKTLTRFQVAMLNQETGLRGYLITGRLESLAPYVAGRADFDRVADQLAMLARANADQAGSAARAIASARAWQNEVGEPAIKAMAQQATQTRARSIEASGQGKRRFDAFRRELALVEGSEQATLARQSAEVAAASELARIALWSSALVTLAICVGAGLILARIVTRPLAALADATRRLVQRDTAVAIPSLTQQNEVGEMARAVEIFRRSLIELDRTSVFRVTADALPALVGYIEADRDIGFLNEEFARWFALEAEDVAELYGKPLAQVFRANSFPGAGHELEQALAGEEARFAFQLAGHDGAMRDFEGVLRPHRAAGGAVIGVVALFTDVNDRKDIDRRLRHQAHDLQRSNEELEQFAYVASHDLKAPLRGIENLASWIEEDLGEALVGEPRVNMDLLKSRVLRLEHLLDDLLAYSRAGRTDLVVREVDTRALVVELAALISPPEGFAIAADAALPTITAAHAALAQVLQNLIGNAVKHHPEPAHGHVWVTAAPVGDAYEYRVADDGPGVPQQFRARVFGMFQTLKPRDEVEGSGMGLAIVRKLVERQGGEVWLSDREGGGLIVHFTWPAHAEER